MGISGRKKCPWGSDSMKPDLYIAIAICNEENTLDRCIKSINEQRMSLSVETFMCLNGCTDCSEKIAEQTKKEYPRLNITILNSDKGKVVAQNTIIRKLQFKDVPVLFVDADVQLSDNSIMALYNELTNNSRLYVVGGLTQPILRQYDSKRKTIWQFLLNIRNIFYQSEVSKNGVTKYKDYIVTYPQDIISPEYEKRSRIFFHGRCFLLRDASIYKVPALANLADDTYLANYIHTIFGKGTIRTRYDAVVYYEAYTSLRDHFNTYRRIYLDKQYLDNCYPEFSNVRKDEQLRLDWDYILKQPKKIVLGFMLYKTIVSAETVLFRILPKKKISEIWKQEYISS